MEHNQEDSTIQQDKYEKERYNDFADSPQILEIVEEINQTTDSIITRIIKVKDRWLGEGFLFAGITLILSLISTSIMVYFIENSYVVGEILKVINQNGISNELIEEVYNPMLIGYSLLYGGDIHAKFLFNNMDTYSFSLISPLFFGIITLGIIWISEHIRFRITKKERDMYASIYMSFINAIVVGMCAWIFSSQITMNAQGMGTIMESPQLADVCSTYMGAVDEPTLEVSLGVDLIRIVAMSFLITIFSLTFCAKKHLFFNNYRNIKHTFIYIMKLLFIAVFILSTITIIKAISLQGESVVPDLSQPYYFRGFIFLLGVFINAVTTGHLSFLNYSINRNYIMQMDMEVFTIDAYVKRELFQLDNPVGSYYLVLVLLVMGLLFIASCTHYRGRKVKFSRGLKEAIAISTILSFSIAMISKLGGVSFKIMCDTTSRSMSYDILEMGVGSTDFWTVNKRVFMITLAIFLIGWGLNQIFPRLVDLLGEIFTSRASIILWIGIILIVAITIALIISPDVIRSVYELYDEAMNQSKGGIILKLRELIR